jgi:hypothetical protein
MRHVAILIPASPVPAFFSQIAAFNRALKSLRWVRWRPSLHVQMGGEVDNEALQRWLPYLDDVALTLLPKSQFLREGIWAQYDGLFHLLPQDADVILRMDADILPIAEFEEVLDRVAETGCVAGVIEHFPFPTSIGLARSEDWQGLARDLIGAPLNLAFRYTLLPDPEWPAPFYVNFGAVYFPGRVWREFSELYLRFRPQLVDRLGESYFAGQVAFALATAKMDVATWALPMRYNFPNDSRAVSLHPDELSRVSVFHYLRTSIYDRHRIFTNSAEYSRFLALPLEGVDLVFQQAVSRILGSEFPFQPSEARAALTRSAAQKRIDDPLSRQSYEATTAEHGAAVGPALAGVEAELAALTMNETR